MEQITQGLPLRKINMFFIEMESEIWVSTELRFKRSFFRQEHILAKLLDSNFCQGIV